MGTEQTILESTSKFSEPPHTASNVPFLSNDYEYYYDDADFNDIDKKSKVPESLSKTVPTTTPPPTSRWSINKESFTEADAKLPPMTTWKPLTFSKNMESFMGPST